MFLLENVIHQYDGQTVLDMPLWKAEQGEQWIMLGPSGSGKTTLLHILAGLLKPTSGNITIAGQDLGTLGAAQIDHFRGQNIGIVFQRMHLFGTLTVRENLLMAQFVAGEPQSEERVDEVLEGLDIGTKKFAYPAQLSVGQAQRVSIARAVINRPKVILADEPTSALDDRNCDKVLELLKKQAETHKATLVITTHDQRIKDAFGNQFNL
ncbi:MAG TPA: ABC transporter ATP-binding protein [Rhodothermales bacterium]|nr:ABC transporter ATP-binding protein [Rhodothermales bacterium]HRR08296.1 ABC transporter ATP-binding protein [Rhodothermales bacterium]